MDSKCRVLCCLFVLSLLEGWFAHSWRVTQERSFNARPSCLRSSPASLSYSHPVTDTIYGLCSAIPDGGCGIAVTRISGKQSLKVLELLTTPQGEKGRNHLFKCDERKATLRDIYIPSEAEPIDKAITLYFKAPLSFTGEDVVEIHTHGSKAIVALLFQALRCISNSQGISLRAAERGEFTRRAFYNGKMDLTQAEALKEVIGAETKLSMHNASLKLRGGLSQIYQSWAKKLRRALALIEAKIDFEEQASTDIQIAEKEFEEIAQDLKQLVLEITRKVQDNKGEILNSSVNVELIGPPNAGKSTLINTICDRDVAIVADVPGTTRDIIQTPYDMYGTKISIFDTAGIRHIEKQAERNSHSAIEKRGIDLALERLKDAHIGIFLYDHTNIPGSQEALQMVKNYVTPEADLIVCVSKTDLLDENGLSKVIDRIRAENPNISGPICLLSSMKHESVDELMNVVNLHIRNRLPVIKTEPLITNARHKSHLEMVIKEIKATIEVIENGCKGLEIIAENMRETLSQIAYIVGEQTNEQILDDIFNTFCIGK